jgi:hypothetical protein
LGRRIRLTVGVAGARSVLLLGSVGATAMAGIVSLGLVRFLVFAPLARRGVRGETRVLGRGFLRVRVGLAARFAVLDFARGAVGVARSTRRAVCTAGFALFLERGFFVFIPTRDAAGRDRARSNI